MKIKSKHPYYVRVVNDEILHIITFDKDYPGKFSVFGGIATVYRKKIDFDQDVLYNLVTLNDTAQFYAYSFKDYSKDDTVFRERSYSYLPNDNDSIEQTFIKALDQAKQYILPVLDNIVSLRDCIDHYMVYHSPIINIISDEYDRECRNEGLLYFKIDDHSDMTQEFRKSLEVTKKMIKKDRHYDSVLAMRCADSEEYRMELISKRDAIYNDPIIYQQVMEELERRRQANIEKLKSYGLFLEKANTQKPKKLTLNAAFKQVFGEALEPLGFVKIKSKHPYYVRVVNEEILHIISFYKDYPGKFTIDGGIATVYREKFDFDQDVLANLNSLNDTAQFYAYSFKDYSKDDTVFCERCYCYLPDDNDSIKQTFIKALEQAKQYILPVLDNIVSLRDCIEHFLVYSTIVCILPDETADFGNNEGLLYFKIDDHSDMTREFKKALEVTKKFIKKDRHYDSILAMRCADSEEYRMELISKRDAIYNDPVVYQQVMEELERRRQANIEKLKSYGLFLEKANTQKPKKLTLNTAFKQVFGEALEPLGFVKIKSKHPYFVRVVNGEILHIITFKKESFCKNAFNVFAGIATVYRKEIDFDQDVGFNLNWMNSIQQFCSFVFSNSTDTHKTDDVYMFEPNNNQSIIHALSDSLEQFQINSLPTLDKICNLRTVIDFYLIYCSSLIFLYPIEEFFNNSDKNNENLLYFKIDDHSDMTLEFNKHIKIQRELRKNRKDFEADFKSFCNRAENYRINQIDKRDAIYNDPVVYQQVMEELERRRQANIEKLKSYGLFLEKANAKKPKKLTLNAAFKQVFGESLEPLGFVKIKSKHPYFVRVVNGEILHIITYRTEQPQYPEDRAFNILGGVATVYRKKIDLSVGIKNNYNWLRSSVDDFYAISLGDDHDRYYRQTISCFYYFSEIEKSMLSALNDSLELVKKYMLPVLNGVDTLEKSIEFFEKFMLLIDTSAYNTDLCFDGDSDYNEGFLYIKTDYQKLKEKWRRIVEGENKILPETLKRVTELYKFFVDPVFNKAVLDELEKRKKSNIENLKLYGVNIN